MKMPCTYGLMSLDNINQFVSSWLFVSTSKCIYAEMKKVKSIIIH